MWLPGARRATPEKSIRLNLSFKDGYFLLLCVLLGMICSEETLELSTVHYPKWASSVATRSGMQMRSIVVASTENLEENLFYVHRNTWQKSFPALAWELEDLMTLKKFHVWCPYQWNYVQILKFVALVYWKQKGIEVCKKSPI